MKEGKVTEWLNPQEFELRFKMSKNWQSKARMSLSKYGLPFSKIGGFILYDAEEIDTWIKEHKVKKAK